MKIEIHNSEPPGDTLLLTCAVRDIAALRQCQKCEFEFTNADIAVHEVVQCPICGQDKCRRKYEVKMVSKYPQIWENNPYLVEFDKPDMAISSGIGKGAQLSNRSGLHVCNASRQSLGKKLSIDIPQGVIRPEIYFSDEEKNSPPEIESRYWLITTGTGLMTAKAWPPERWQAVVDALPEIQFVQIGLSGDNHPKLHNVIDYIGKTDKDMRRLFKLFLHADGSMGGVSFQMHIAGALGMPCVVVAGSREPPSYERYMFHRYLDTQGCMVCDTDDTKKYMRHLDITRSCWRCAIDRCPRQKDGYAECLLMIQPEDVIREVKRYYQGGALPPLGKSKTKRQQVFKMVGNAGLRGGGEMSINWILNRMVREGYKVQLVPTKGVSDEWRKAMPDIEITNKLTEPCDILLYYANDSVYELGKGRYHLFNHLNAGRKVMVINYRVGHMGNVDWTKGWDQYIFLCSDLQSTFLKRCPDANTSILPPPIDLSPFLDVEIDYDQPLHIVRHSSQGDAKWPKDAVDIINRIIARRPDVKFSFMGYPSFLPDMPCVEKINAYSVPVPEFLKRGNVFWYMLPDGYYEGGGRAVLEAMAAGLPVIADRRGGPKDYIAKGTGWLCDTTEDHVNIIASIGDIEDRGLAAKEHARAFDPERWVGEIVG